MKTIYIPPPPPLPKTILSSDQYMCVLNKSTLWQCNIHLFTPPPPPPRLNIGNMWLYAWLSAQPPFHLLGNHYSYIQILYLYFKCCIFIMGS